VEQYPRKLISLKEAAEHVPGADENTLKRKIRAGKLTAYRVGKAYTTTLADVNEMVQASRVVPKEIASTDARLAKLKAGASSANPLGLSEIELASMALDLVLEQQRGKKRKR
jgi:hypothetical protein